MPKKFFNIMCMSCFFALIFVMAISGRPISDMADFGTRSALTSIVVQDITTGETRTLRPKFNNEEIAICLSLQKDAGQDTHYAIYYVSIFYEDNINVYYTVQKEEAGYDFFQELFTPEYKFIL